MIVVAFNFYVCPSLTCRLTLADLWQSGANVTEPGFVSMMWLDCVGSLASPLLCPFLSFCLSPPTYTHFYLLPLDVESSGGKMASDWLGCWSASLTQTHLSSFSLHLFSPEEAGWGQAGELTHLQTGPSNLASPSNPSSSLTLPQLFLEHTNMTLTLRPPLHVGAKGSGQPVRPMGGLVCGTVLISTGVWRRKPHYLPPPHSFPSRTPPLFLLFRSPLSASLEVAFHHSACVARFVKDVAASCLFMDGCQPLSPYSSIYCHFLIYFQLNFFFSLSTFRCTSVNKLCLFEPFLVFQPCPRTWTSFYFLKFLFPDCHLRCTQGMLAQPWQGRAEQGAHVLADCLYLLTLPQLCSLWEQCVKSKILNFPDTPVPFAFFSCKGQRSAGRQRELYVPS